MLLDRDGTIIAEKHYLSNPDDVELLEGAAEGLRLLYDSGFGLIVVSNQSGIGRGLFTPSELLRVELRLRWMLKAKGIGVEAFYYCPHTPEENCDCRKPQPGLATRAAADFGFDPQNCWIIGDKPADIELAAAAGARGILVRTGYGAIHEAQGLAADHVSDNLLEAAKFLLKQSSFNKIQLTESSAERLRSHLNASIQTKQRLLEQCEPEILEIAGLFAAAFAAGRKLLFCGNGGSASDCQHIAAEFVSVLTQQFLRPVCRPSRSPRTRQSLPPAQTTSDSKAFSRARCRHSVRPATL